MCPQCRSEAIVFAGLNPGDPQNGYAGGEAMYRCVVCRFVGDESEFET